MMKKYAAVLMAMLAAATLAFSGCAKDETSSDETSSTVTVNVSCTDAYNAAIDGLEMPAMQVFDPSFTDSTVTDYYYIGLDLSKLSDYAVGIPMMMVHATEVAVFKPVDAAAATDIKAVIADRVAVLEQNWSQYLPEQYELVQNHQIVEHNGYILFVVSEFPDKIVEQFKAALE